MTSSPDPQPRSVEVDARFLLANERTLLAWARTSLALMAGGGAIAQAATSFQGRRPLAGVTVVLGILAALVGAYRYHRADRALRVGQLPPTRQEPIVLAVALAVVGVVLLVVAVA